MDEIKDGPYLAGDVRLATPRCGEKCDNAEHDHTFYYGEEPTVYLPHSCNEWVIGGRKEVEAMIRDLQEVLKTI